MSGNPVSKKYSHGAMEGVWHGGARSQRAGVLEPLVATQSAAKSTCARPQMVSSPSRPEAKSGAHQPDGVSGQNTHGAAGVAPAGPQPPQWASVALGSRPKMPPGGHASVASCPSQVNRAPEGTFLLPPSSGACCYVSKTHGFCLPYCLAKQRKVAASEVQLHRNTSSASFWQSGESLNPRDGRAFAWRSPV